MLMKGTCLLLLVLILFACGQKQDQTIIQSKSDTIIELPISAMLPEYQKRKIFQSFINEIDYSGSRNFELWFTKFRADYYPTNSLEFDNYGSNAFIYYALKEELINPNKISNRKWFRLLIIPSFDHTTSLTLEREIDYYTLTYKIYGKAYSSVPDYLMFSYSDRTVDTLKYNSFFKSFTDNGFIKKADIKKSSSFLHPITFVFEAIDNNKYNKFEIQNPWNLETATKEEYRLTKDALQLITSSTIYPVLKKVYPADADNNYNTPYEFIENLTTE